jgi:hypothetical protein
MLHVLRNYNMQLRRRRLLPGNLQEDLHRHELLADAV